MKIALEYKGYNYEIPVAYGSDEISKLNLDEMVDHYWSLGPDEPIENVGKGKKYRIVEINEAPEWLVRGLHKVFNGSNYSEDELKKFAYKIKMEDIQIPHARALSILYDLDSSSFGDSLKRFYSEKGYLTNKQELVLYKIQRRRRNV